MLLTTTLLAGWLALQDPPRPPPSAPPQDPPRAGDASSDARRGASIDPELRAAIDELRRAKSYRIEVDGVMSHHADDPLADGADAKRPDPPRSGEEGDAKVAHAKERAGGTETFHLQCTFQREKPVQIKAEKIEAYRSSDQLVWRATGKSEWTTIPAHVGEPPKESAESVGSDEARVANMLACLPLPDDFVSKLDSRILSCQRVAGGDDGAKGAKGVKDAGSMSFECIVAPPDGSGSPIVKDAQRSDGAHGDSQRADTRKSEAPGQGKHDGRNCSLRFTLIQGHITQIVFQHPADGAAAPAVRPTDTKQPKLSDPRDLRGDSIRCDYQLSSMGSANVTIPEDAARRFGSH